MRIFAQYVNLGTQEIRNNTILQFGNSWNLIANVVMFSPGKSLLAYEVNEKDKINLKKYFLEFGDRKIDIKDFYEFKKNQTMDCIQKMFSGFYIKKSRNLSGVINIFNLFDMKNFMEEKNNLAFISDIKNSYFCDKVVYFGFGNKIKSDKKALKLAEQIYNQTSKKSKILYKRDFFSEKFYHPLYINRAYSFNENIQFMLKRLDEIIYS